MNLKTSHQFKFLPCLDSHELAESRKQALIIPHQTATFLGRSAVEAINQGHYLDSAGIKVDWSAAVNSARQSRK